ncbi:hypothetical protein BVC80_8059g6 [Macleaya cordata]|uniref:Uncharacterized protein n=1 Tax=Macleaya cordata TaxID=56857 RepID=A0A200PMF5_MACCD|nr:hypothetical protein BVC80_8059g6 [Macleaya cordata]
MWEQPLKDLEAEMDRKKVTSPGFIPRIWRPKGLLLDQFESRRISRSIPLSLLSLVFPDLFQISIWLNPQEISKTLGLSLSVLFSISRGKRAYDLQEGFIMLLRQLFQQLWLIGGCPEDV